MNHPIKGYRTLNPVELELINRIKAHQAEAEKIVADLRVHLYQYRENVIALVGEEFKAEVDRLEQAEPERWVQVGRTNIQQGCMALVRAVAQPSV